MTCPTSSKFCTRSDLSRTAKGRQSALQRGTELTIWNIDQKLIFLVQLLVELIPHVEISCKLTESQSMKVTSVHKHSEHAVKTNVFQQRGTVTDTVSDSFFQQRCTVTDTVSDSFFPTEVHSHRHKFFQQRCTVTDPVSETSQRNQIEDM